MTHFAGKAVKVLTLFLFTTLLLAVTALAAEKEMTVAVGATTGSSLRMRAAASTSSSIVSTLDKGVAVEILNMSNPDWYKVSQDGDTGYVSSDFLVVDQDNRFTSYGRVSADGVNIRSAATVNSQCVANVEKDTIITVNSFVNGWYEVTCKYGTRGFIRSDLVDLTDSAETSSRSGASIVKMAKSYLGTPYVYGGSSPRGFDCSGFTMYIYQKHGVSLPHSATSQWLSGKGKKVYSPSAMQPGDLVFFCDPSRSKGKACSHAGIYIGGNRFIHASSSRSNGVITSSLSGYYSTYFVGGLHVL